MTTILILGAGIMQVPGIRIAKRKGWRTIIVDGNPDAMARDMGDGFEHVDLKDRDGLLAVARRYKASGGLDGIFTAGTDFSSSVAWVAEKLGLPGITFAAAMRATDKCLMRTAFQSAGVPGPRFSCWTGQGDPAALLASGLDFPLVVKPVDNMGARGVRRADTVSELADACRAALPLSRSSRVIVEQYMEGPELSLDAVVSQGRIIICGVADRHICFPPSFVEMGHTMPTALDGKTVARIVEAFEAGIRAIGIDNGAAKGDLKLTPRGPMVGEIAARLSGGYMSGWTYPLSSGVEVTEAALNVAVGLPPGDLSPTLHRTCAERALISIPGIVEQIEGSDAARRLPGVQELFLRVAAGAEVVFPANNVQKCGNVIAVAEGREEAASAARHAIAATTIRLRPLVDRTTQWLFRDTVNDAFPDAGGALPRAVAAMPVFRGSTRDLPFERPLAIESLECWEASTATDWYGETLPCVVRRVVRLGGAEILRDRAAGSRFVIGRPFWQALRRGGAQGALYLLDSVRSAARAGRLEELLSRL